MRFEVSARRPGLLPAFLLGISLPFLVGTAPLGAQSVPTGFQEYFVIGYEQHVWEMLTRV